MTLAGLVDSCEGSPHLRELDTVVLYVVTDTLVNRDYVETDPVVLSYSHVITRVHAIV